MFDNFLTDGDARRRELHDRRQRTKIKHRLNEICKRNATRLKQVPLRNQFVKPQDSSSSKRTTCSTRPRRSRAKRLNSTTSQSRSRRRSSR
jgi:hypothetical protein